MPTDATVKANSTIFNEAKQDPQAALLVHYLLMNLLGPAGAATRAPSGVLGAVPGAPTPIAQPTIWGEPGGVMGLDSLLGWLAQLHGIGSINKQK